MGDVTHIGFKYRPGDSFKIEMVISYVDNEEKEVSVYIPALFDYMENLDLPFDDFLETFDPERVKERLLREKEYIEKQLLELESLEE